MLRLIVCFLIIASSVFSGARCHAETPSMPSGTYNLDPRHTSIIFKIDHLGFSHFTGRFDKVTGSFDYNADAPDQSQIDITIFPNSVDTNDAELDDTLRSDNWFDVIKYPQATFHALRIEPTGGNSAKITGDFTLHDVTHTVTLDAVLVGAGKMPFEDKQIMGFAATGSFNRSDYGINNLEPFVGDKVSLEIDTEFDKDM